jgi:phosphoglycan beta-1,3-galactosyltransferase
MDSSISPAQSASRKRRAFGAAFGTDNSYPYRSLELYHNESSGTGSANSSARDNSMLTSQSLHISSDSPPSLGQILDLPPHSPGSPQKKPSSPSATARRSRRWRHPRGLKWRVALVMLIFLLISGVLWIMHQDATAAPQSGSSHRRTGAATARRPQPSSTSAAATNAKKEHTAIEGKLPLHTTTTSTTTTTTIADAEPTNTTIDTTTTSATPITKPSTTTAAPAVDEKRSTWGVLVQHEDIIHRLRLHKRCGRATATNPCPTLYVDPRKLPSWTLHAIPRDCVDCTDPGLYAATTNGTKLQAHHGVFASTTGPLGRVGPMLYAMSSVTNDINVQEELPRWSWLAHVYPNFPTVTSGATENTDEVHEAPRPYLAVMGVPSTDQPARVALRTAQRATWMRYQEVARTENNFEGALLPLYLFAATEMTSESPATTAEVKEGDDVAAGPLEADPEANEMDNEDAAAQTTQPTTTTTTSTTSTPAPPPEVSMCGRTDVLLPTVREFQRASSLFARLPGAGAQEQGKGPDRDMSDDSFVQRRVVLRSDYPSADVLESPCRGVVEAHVNAAAVPHLPLTRLSRSIGLNITPAFVSAAQYICCASAALWKEALTHRNVVWIDMLTDRRPTTNKKLGDTTKWGLPVEVGMSQKLILWLSYAYHAFPNVPYIIKGDDDMYLKVPQFLSDARMLRRGRRNGRLPPPPLLSSAVADGKAVNTYVDPDEPFPMDKTKCMYWGSTRRMRNFYFNAGMLFVLQRRLVQVVLERPQEGSGEKDLLELAARNYSKSLFRLYKSLSFDKEDVLIGATLHRRHARAKELCYKHQVWYGFEERVRFHDLRKGRAQPITVNTVVAHRCRPADLYFMQYFFQNELAFARADVAPGESREDLAREAAAAWVAETRKTLPDDVTNWNSLPEVVWYHNVHTGPSFWIAENDHVPVYNVSYTFWNSSQLTVEVGYKGRSHAMSKP